MRAGTFAMVIAIFLGCLLVTEARLFAQSHQDRVVRLAELEIDAGSLDRYTAALRDEISASIRVEPGVLALYAVSVKDHPTQIRLFEMYASPAAYEAHLQSPHFKHYKAQTAAMVKSLKLIETEPLLLGAK
jgi:quinol monooxygenase YgiN